jgi:hypothetical protein
VRDFGRSVAGGNSALEARLFGLEEWRDKVQRVVTQGRVWCHVHECHLSVRLCAPERGLVPPWCGAAVPVGKRCFLTVINPFQISFSACLISSIRLSSSWAAEDVCAIPDSSANRKCPIAKKLLMRTKMLTR